MEKGKGDGKTHSKSKRKDDNETRRGKILLERSCLKFLIISQIITANSLYEMKNLTLKRALGNTLLTCVFHAVLTRF